MLPLPLDDENQRLEAIDSRDHHDRDERELSRAGRDSVDQVPQVDAGRRQNDRPKEIDKDDKSHAETTEPTQILEKDQLRQIVHGRVDPATSLREQHRPRLGRRRAGVGVGHKLIGHGWKMFGHQRG